MAATPTILAATERDPSLVHYPRRSALQVRLALPSILIHSPPANCRATLTRSYCRRYYANSGGLAARLTARPYAGARAEEGGAVGWLVCHLLGSEFEGATVRCCGATWRVFVDFLAR